MDFNSFFDLTANGKSGVLIFGITNDDEVIGIEAPEKVAEKISETITAKLDPIPDTTLKFEVVDGKTLIFLEVAAGSQTPYYYVSDGTRIAYVRVGNESIPASAADLKRLVLRGSNTSFDSLSTHYPFDSLAFTKLRSVYRMRTGTELTDSDFVSFELVDENNMLTNAGVLLADDSPMRHSRLFCTRWYGLDKASGIMDALDDKEYSGSLISLLQNGAEFVKNNTKKRWKKTGNGRIEMPEYPEQAVHEVIVNALIHRDYMELGSEVHIDIFDDRMEIYSPGGMFDGSIVQELDTDNVASKRRNPVIADIFSRMHFMERRGSGFKKIKADYRRAVNYRPEVEPMFKSTPTSFFATLYNLNYGVNIESEDDGGNLGGNGGNLGGNKIDLNSPEWLQANEFVILELLRDNPKLTIAQLVKETKIPERSVQRHLKSLKEKGYIKRQGSTRGLWIILK